MFEEDSTCNLYDPFRRRLTSDDIEQIEEGMDFLLGFIYGDDQEMLEEELQMDLPHKMKGYIRVADSHTDDPNLAKIAMILGDGMRALLKLVHEYYIHLN